ncbi:Isochorismatase-like protein [Gymnopilus junonius]|uniref:Isochorismatase-like protein n=1 Tax=Gymnopilus junonius TaxID=109634 RepID=A0A9P5P399_GYMJU|nr:Isochorismatase-like protein [Gymnopilus junonius]
MPSPPHSLFFLCDIQTKFKPAIHAYHHVVATANKMVRLANLLDIPVVVTTQNTKALGPTDPEIDLQSLGSLLHGPFDKSLFSMYTPEVQAVLDALPIESIVIFGIESHVCVLQTVLALLATAKYTVHVVTDGVSSCNSFEIPIALDRLRAEGAIVGTSESIAFQLMRDASSPNFKAFSKFIKEVKETTKATGEVLLQGRSNSSTSQTEIASRGIVLKSAM